MTCSATALVEKQGPWTHIDGGELLLELDEQSSLEVLRPQRVVSSAAATLIETWTSASAWPAGGALALHLWHSPERHAQKLRVLELACGSSALPGTVMAICGHNVTFADLPAVLEDTRRAVSHNLQRVGGEPGATSFEGYTWSQEPLAGEFDLVIGSDVVYAREHVSDVARWLRTLETDALLAGEDRSGLLTQLRESMVADGLRVTALPLPRVFWRRGSQHPALELMSVQHPKREELCMNVSVVSQVYS